MWEYLVANRIQITLFIALIGAGLGIANLIRDIRRTNRHEQVKIEIFPKLGMYKHGGLLTSEREIPKGPSFLVAVVVNHSYFPVFIDKLSVELEAPRGAELHSLKTISNPNKQWPIKLERFEAVTLIAEEITSEQLAQLGARSVFVTTSNGIRFKGSSAVIDALST